MSEYEKQVVDGSVEMLQTMYMHLFPNSFHLIVKYQTDCGFTRIH